MDRRLVAPKPEYLSWLWQPSCMPRHAMLPLGRSCRCPSPAAPHLLQDGTWVGRSFGRRSSFRMAGCISLYVNLRAVGTLPGGGTAADHAGESAWCKAGIRAGRALGGTCTLHGWQPCNSDYMTLGINSIMTQSLEETARQLAAPGKGLLASDESTGTIGKRLEKALGEGANTEASTDEHAQRAAVCRRHCSAPSLLDGETAPWHYRTVSVPNICCLCRKTAGHTESCSTQRPSARPALAEPYCSRRRCSSRRQTARPSRSACCARVCCPASRHVLGAGGALLRAV